MRVSGSTPAYVRLDDGIFYYFFFLKITKWKISKLLSLDGTDLAFCFYSCLMIDEFYFIIIFFLLCFVTTDKQRKNDFSFTILFIFFPICVFVGQFHLFHTIWIWINLCFFFFFTIFGWFIQIYFLRLKLDFFFGIYIFSRLSVYCNLGSKLLFSDVDFCFCCC